MKDVAMPRYSVAETKDNLSALIDKALSGEEVVITRRGKSTVRLVPSVESLPRKDVRGAMDRLRAELTKLPPIDAKIPYHRFYEWLYEDED